MFYKLYDYVRDRYFDEIKDEAAPVREALIFRHTLEQIPVRINGDDCIAGWHGYETKPPDMEMKPPCPRVFAEKSPYTGRDLEVKKILSDCGNALFVK